MNISILRMILAKLPLLCVAMVALSISLYPKACVARRQTNLLCVPSFCGNLSVSHPFRLRSQPSECGDPRLELVCDDNNQTLLLLKHGKFYVHEISYVTKTALLVDASLERDKCTIPPSSFYDDPERGLYFTAHIMYLLACPSRVNSSLFVDATPCSNSSSSFSSGSYLYFVDESPHATDFPESCTIEAEVPLPNLLRNSLRGITGLGVHDIYQHLLMGFQIEWSDYNYEGDIPDPSWKAVIHTM